MAKKSSAGKTVTALTHNEATRKNIPTAEYESLVQPFEKAAIQVAYERRDPDLDPQLIWRNKYEGPADLLVSAQPLYSQEKVHPKALIDDLLRATRERRHEVGEIMPDLFADFNGLPYGADKTDFYQHDQNWSNRMILGDSLRVMVSLAEREGLRGMVQCIYVDPPYGIKFNSNFQWSTTSREVKDGNIAQITREPEQVKAFRDTWRDNVHTYLTYLRERLTAARDLLADSGSIFVQIGDENIHRVRCLMDEIFGDRNAIVTIYFRKTTTQSGDFLADTNDYILWYAKKRELAKFRALHQRREGYDWVNYDFVMSEDLRQRRLSEVEKKGSVPLASGERVYRRSPLTSTSASESTLVPFRYEGGVYKPGKGGWKTNSIGLERLAKSHRIETYGVTASFRRYTDDFPFFPLSNSWTDTASGGYGADKVYVVQTNVKIVERCLLMTTDPGDLVLDPTCGAGTTAYVAEQWGRRWITIDTSRVALALARARVMGARYPYYTLADSRAGQRTEAAMTRSGTSSHPVHGDIRHGFVYERVPHVTLESIANNAEVDVIWERSQQALESLRESLNALLKQNWQEWEIPRDSDPRWASDATKLHAEWWQVRIARQQEIDKSIAARAEFEYLYDKPYQEKKIIRVAGPFTVESMSPHRVMGVGPDEELIDPLDAVRKNGAEVGSFAETILEDLKIAGVQQAHKADKIIFTALAPWPGDYICADGRYIEGDMETGKERRAGIFIGPEFGTVRRADLVAAAKEAADAGFDVLIACAFAYEARTTEFNKLGALPVLKARMNADLHMSDDLKNTGKGNLFVIFGEPDIELIHEPDDELRVKIKGVDVFKPSTGEVISDGSDGIACWFVDTDYNEESFFVRHAYFLGAGDPYGALKTTLKAEIDADTWSSLNSDTSRAFPKPKSARIAVKVINHLGDEVMKIFKVG
jgi:adenine-specific DNA-methyltransferase